MSVYEVGVEMTDSLSEDSHDCSTESIGGKSFNCRADVAGTEVYGVLATGNAHDKAKMVSTSEIDCFNVSCDVTTRRCKGGVALTFGAHVGTADKPFTGVVPGKGSTSCGG